MTGWWARWSPASTAFLLKVALKAEPGQCPGGIATSRSNHEMSHVSVSLTPIPSMDATHVQDELRKSNQDSSPALLSCLSLWA